MGFFKEMGDVIKGALLDPISEAMGLKEEPSNSKQYVVYVDGFKKILTFKYRQFDGSDLYKDQFGHLWVTRDDGKTFERDGY